MLESSSGDFYGPGDFFGGIFTVLKTSGDFHRAGDFFELIFRLLETSSGIFVVLETSFGDFLGVFSRCWRLFGGF